MPRSIQRRANDGSKRKGVSEINSCLVRFTRAGRCNCRFEKWSAAPGASLVTGRLARANTTNPCVAGSCGMTTTLLGMQVLEAGWVDAWTPLRDAVTYKGNTYGEPDR